MNGRPIAIYLLYLPGTLKKDRRAPWLFYTYSGGGCKGLRTKITETAELSGWVLAMSIESGNDYTGSNLGLCAIAVKYSLKMLPVDDDRLDFTGNSGGGRSTVLHQL
jgi:hypothetical protein